jgi:hypothetical protein
MRKTRLILNRLVKYPIPFRNVETQREVSPNDFSDFRGF